MKNDIIDTPRVDCPACGEGLLSPLLEKNLVEYRGVSREIDCHSSVCDVCGSELTGPAESKKNKRIMNAFKKEVEGLLAGSDIRAFRKRFDLRQDLCAELFGGGSIAFSRYENDDVLQSISMDRLIKRCMNEPSNILAIAKENSIALPEESIRRITAAAQEKIMALLELIKMELEEETGRSHSARTFHHDCANDNVFKIFEHTSSRQRQNTVRASWAIEAAA